MKKRILVMMMVMALIIASLGMAMPVESQGENAWVLVDVVDYPQEEAWKLANQHVSYNTDVTYSRSSFSTKQTYIGRTEGRKVNGEGVKIWGDISPPPKVIYKDQEVSLTVELKATENTLSFFTFGGSIKVDFYPQVDISPSMGRGITFNNSNGEYYTYIGGNHGYNPVKETVKAKAPTGQKTGEQRALRQSFIVSGIPISTYYIYEWKSPSGTTPSTPSDPGRQTQGFSDLPASHWAYDNIMEMAKLGILDGYADGTFKPNKTISRAEFSKILVLSLKLPKVTPISPAFSDVPSNHWAYEVVESSKNYLTGYRSSSGAMSFAPNEVAVREDVAVAIVKAKGLGDGSANLSLLNQFSDQGQISNALRSHVAIAVAQGYMQGTNIGFEPQKALTRAEASTLLSRLIDRGQFEDREKVPYN